MRSTGILVNPSRPVMSSGDRLAEGQLFARYHEHGDPAAREALVERFLPFARDLALRYAYMDEPFDDLQQVASVGLLKAINRFEPGRGTKFISYAAPTILGELKRHFRDQTWALHVPRVLKERDIGLEQRDRGADKETGALAVGPRSGNGARLLARTGAGSPGGGHEL